MKTVKLRLTVDLVLKLKKGVSVDDVINEMDYSFIPSDSGAVVEDSAISDYEVKNSR